MALVIRVPGVPIAQPRVKATIRGQHAGVYTPETKSNGRSNGVAELKATIRVKAEEAKPDGPLLSGPLRVDCEFVFPRHGNKVWSKKPMPRYRHVERPDRDNLDKLVMDALKGVLWVDDNQVCSGTINKWRAAGDESPHIVITVTELGDGE